MSADEIRSEVVTIIAVNNATAADMGKIIGLANKHFAGKADGKTISGIVKELLT